MKLLAPCIAITSLLIAGCSTTSGYNFRDEHRPTFERSIDAAELSATSGNGVKIIDVRLPEDYALAPRTIPGATYLDPDQIEDWSSSLPRNEEIVVYCVAGRWVSQKAADYLTRQGFNVRTLEGGIEAWQRTNSGKLEQ